jgi:hypothetical protein
MSILVKAEKNIAEKQGSDHRQIVAFRKVIRLHEHKVPRFKLTTAPIPSPAYPKAKFFFFQTMLVFRLTEVMLIVEGDKDIDLSSVPKHRRRAILGCGTALVRFSSPFFLQLVEI